MSVDISSYHHIIDIIIIMRQQSPLTLPDAGMEEMSVRGRWTSRRHNNQSYRHPKRNPGGEHEQNLAETLHGAATSSFSFPSFYLITHLGLSWGLLTDSESSFTFSIFAMVWMGSHGKLTAS
jgi:hypothetical protein